MSKPEDTAREIKVLAFMDDDPESDDQLYDFRPTILPADTPDQETDPKAVSSVTDFAETEKSEMPMETDSNLSEDNPVSVAKDQSQTPEDETTPGKSEEPASEKTQISGSRRRVTQGQVTKQS